MAVLHLRESPAKAFCEVHNWPEDGLAKRIIVAARATYPDGLNVCKHCVDRAKVDAEKALAQRPQLVVVEAPRKRRVR